MFVGDSFYRNEVVFNKEMLDVGTTGPTLRVILFVVCKSLGGPTSDLEKLKQSS